MRRALAAAAVAAALPCAALVATPQAAHADGCGAFAWAQVGYTYLDGSAVPAGVPGHDASQGEALPTTGPGCNDFTEPLDVRAETVNGPVTSTAIITLDSSLADSHCTAWVGSLNGVVDVPLTNVDGTPHGEVPYPISSLPVGITQVNADVTCDGLELTPTLQFNVIGSPDNTSLALTHVVSKVRTLVTGRLTSRRTHRGIGHAMIRIRRHGLRVGTAYTDRHGYYTWHNQGAPTDHVWARYRPTVRHLGSTSR